MDQERTTRLATAIVIATGTIWGFYWLPVRQLADLGIGGAWGTAAITLCATLCLLPVAFRQRARLLASDPVALASVALGGAAFALYSIGFNYGRVAIIILLFFLSPVWSTLIARYVFGWRTPRLRLVAIALGLAGLGTMLGAEGEWPLPRTTGEWMALASGIGWSLATTGLRMRPAVGAGEAAFLFAAGATLTALVMALVLPGAEEGATSLARWPMALGIAVVTGALWWAASMVGLIWASKQLDPARTGILLMAEVLIGSVSAALLAGEHLSPLEITGGALVLASGVLEVWPVKSQAERVTSRQRLR
ncbi:EamA-like transporter family protein [Roseivivax sp. THAF40]|uniref:DMT family transporter n=1 Tax=unclassified Roseivivax TaxID=2639302 RepID=UPI001267E6C3|nr:MULTISPECIES: DMT family transporter [unclassified Roseivivax]QFS81606.1 EamA-like transporter family protein [Roseivivax sp. THAF197b]QFT45335.1 EamA-like transporter family protein [Roseivivax sp. THAF40]